MSPQIYILLVSGAVFAAIGQVLFKIGASGREALLAFVNPWILLGLLSYGVGTVLWIWSLSKAKLTVAYPFTALTFVLVYLFGVFLLGEQTSAKAVLGALLVLAGLFLTSTA